MQKRKLNDIRHLDERIFLAAGNFLRVFCRFDVLAEAPNRKKFGYINVRRAALHIQMCSVRNEE